MKTTIFTKTMFLLGTTVLLSANVKAQTIQWISRYPGLGNELDIAYAIYVDGSGAGNVYVTGTSSDLNVFPDNRNIVTIKYDAGGNQL